MREIKFRVFNTINNKVIYPKEILFIQNLNSLDAYNESGNKQFSRLVPNFREALKATINNPFSSKVSWIIYKKHKFTMSEVFQLSTKMFNKGG